tara:strand:+ start:174 stop:815 length:642 start_codon:yes stop_codon:yes gene_type:complete
MPRPAINDYIIYKIININNDIDLCYVGSTANLKLRTLDHKHNSKNISSTKYNQKKYQLVREHGGWDEFKIVVLEEIQQITKRQAEQIEEKYRIEMKANMNDKSCYKSNEERLAYARKYSNINYENNKQKCQEANKKYYENNKEKCMATNKLWCENNREKCQEASKKYYEKNKHKSKDTIICECGFEGSKGHIARHRKSPSHIKFMEENNLLLN